jgi:hypothetical protein
MLSNIRPSDQVLRAVTNGGSQVSRLIGDFPNLGPVWYNPESIANILSLAEVRRVCRVTMDTSESPAFIVHRLDGSEMRFEEADSGLYVFSSNDSTAVKMYTLLQTVAGQKKLFNKRQIDAADEARRIYRIAGRPSEEDFEWYLRENFIRNSPITADDAKRATAIYGPDVAALKGKTRRGADAPHVPSFKAIPIPAPILLHHRDVTLCSDFLFVQGIPFFHTISRNIGFRTLTAVPDRSKKTILRETRRAINIYTTRGFIVHGMHCDNEFGCIKDDVLPVKLDIVPADSHVGEVERSIRTIRERTRAAVHGMPYKRLPKLMVIELVKEAVRCLNLFPRRDGISTTMSPNTIVTGEGFPDYNKMTLEFGEYVQIYEPTTPTNTLHSCTLGAIALGPSGNANGDYAFMSLATGARVTRHQWQRVDRIPDTAIDRVHALALAEDQPLIQDSGLVFEWDPDMPIDDDEYDKDYFPLSTERAGDHDLDSRFLPVDADELLSLTSPVSAPSDIVMGQGASTEPSEAPTPDNQGAEIQGAEAQGAENGDDDDDEADEDFYPATDVEGDVDDPSVEDQGAPDVITNETSNEPVDNGDSTTHDPPTRNVFCMLQEATKSVEEHIITDSVRRVIVAIILTQMSEQAGLKKHGRRAEHALMQEFQQLDDLTVFIPRYASELTPEEKSAALRALNLLKEKRDGSLKGRTVADGSKQRSLYDKSETASPTVSADALICSVMIDAVEGRDSGICDVAGAYLKAFMEDFVILKFSGKAVEILCRMSSKYLPYVCEENGKKVIYVQLKKALYGCVKSALLWYKMFSETLQNMGFELNPYDQCVANCDFNGSQCTIVWYVDDMKVSHKDPEVVSAVISNIESSFGKMTVKRGKEHEFLGMKIVYNENNTATITMRSYLEEAIAESGLNITNTAATPARRYLFDVNEKSPRLDKKRNDIFHSVSAKLLYVATRARMDILLPVCFLCTRVSKATEEDELKLKRVLEYVNGTLDLSYTIGADDLGKMQTWVDASYAVHPDMRSHTGGIISFGRGGLICKSSKQKLNTKSSTEAELVGASDYLPNTLWLKMFLEAQGHRIVENVLQQDNESAIKLEKNGRTSAGPKSRHINIRYFFIKDRIKAEGIKIRHCPTLKMIADFFTKPLQGKLFLKLRSVIMGYDHISSLDDDDEESIQIEERVGRYDSGSSFNRSEDTSLKTDVDKKEHMGKKSSKTVTWADVVRGGFKSSFS